jgi:hypothetical protein
MKPKPLTGVFTCILTLFFCLSTKAQSFGIKASAIWLTDCNQDNYYNSSGSGPDLIAPAGNIFSNNNFGAHTQNSGTLKLRGAQVKTFKTPGISNVCSVRMFYRVHLQSATPGSFTPIDLPLVDDCNAITSQYPSGGTCIDGDQKWDRVIPDGITVPYAPVNLTTLAPGNYVLDVYFDVTGSATTTTACDQTIVLDNSGNYYKAYFSIQNPVLSGSLNPTTCNGSQGSITISGLATGTTYSISYYDDGVLVGPLTLTATAAGQVIITGLNAGVYSDFEFIANGCITQLNTGQVLSNPVYTPTFNPIPPFCAGNNTTSFASYFK